VPHGGVPQDDGAVDTRGEGHAVAGRKCESFTVAACPCRVFGQRIRRYCSSSSGRGMRPVATLQRKREYTTVKNGAPQPMNRLNAPINAFCWRPLLILKDAPARAQTSLAGDSGEQSRRSGGQQVPHMRPRRARWKRTA